MATVRTPLPFAQTLAHRALYPLPLPAPTVSGGDVPTLTSRQLAAQAAKAATAAAAAPEAPERRSAKGEAEPRPDGESCYECARKSAGRGDAIIFCESCEYGYHQKCHGGPLMFVVPGEKDTWFCACAARRAPAPLFVQRPPR